MTRKLLIIGTLGLAVLMAPKSMGQLGQWDFNSGTLAQSAGATLGDLTYANVATSSGTAFGSCSSFGIPNIGTSNALVMRFPAATNGMGYLMPTPAANGGGSTVNEWTLIVDVLYPVGSDSVLRPIIDSDGSTVAGGGLVIGPDFIVSGTDGVGQTPTGPFNGTINPNTWYRIGISVTAAEVDIFVDGNQVYSGAGAGLDSQFGMSAGSAALILGSITNQAAPGYVNSIQLRNVALNAGQMLALGAATGGGIPQTIPPVPAFIQVRTPGVSATRVSPTPSIHVVLNQGDTTVTPGSVKLFMDGALVPGTAVVETPPTFDVAANISTILDPNSLHTLSLVWQDSVLGNATNTWNYTVIPYQNLNLPAPFYFENFNGLTESATAPAPLPAGWTVTNQTTPDTAGYDIADRDSDAYLDWVLVSSSRFATWGSDRTDLPPIVLNGSMLTTLTDGNLMWAESDQRCGGCQGQYQELYTADINCTGRTNVYVAWKSIYEQNQDNMNLCEYSINQGASWLPVRYLFCTLGNGENSDIYYTNGVIDVGATFSTVEPNRNWAPDAIPTVHATNYGIYLKAPISSALIPYIVGYTNDDTVNGKEIVVVRLPQADGQPKVRFRFLDTGTSAWFWGIDDLGLYEINTPVITGQPTNVTVSAGSTAIFSVAATSPTALTYHWKHAGTNLVNGGHFSGATNATLTVSNAETNDAGAYICVVANTFGSVNSASVNLTVITAPQITSQPTTVVSSVGGSVALNVSALGRPPLVYQWLKNGTPTGPNSTTLSFPSVQLSNADRYQVNVTNSEGAALSRNVRVVVSPDDLTSNLVVHITFDGNYSDTSGHANDATAVAGGSAPDGGPALVAGKLGQALQFTTKKDGSVLDYATLGYPSDLKFGSDVDYSVSFWCNYTGQSDDPPLISNKNWDSSGNKGWGVFTQSDGHYRVNITGSGGTKYDIGSGQTPLIMNGIWHNVIVSHARANGGSGIISVYNDGVLAITRDDLTTGSVDTDDLSYAVNIGQDGRGTYTDGGSAGITNALLDDVGIWRRALSSQEAAGIYDAGQSGKNIAQAVSARKLSFSVSGGNLVITWTGTSTLKLQKSPTLSPATWTDVAGTLGASIATIPITGTAQFFKLAQ